MRPTYRPEDVVDFNVAQVIEAIGAALPERECIIFGERRYDWQTFLERTRRFAHYLRSRGLGSHRERQQLKGYESGQDHLALYLYNGNEYIESMTGSYGARVAPFNVNYRYVEEELLYLLRDSGARAVVYHAAFAPILEKVLPSLTEVTVLIQVADASGNALLRGAVDYEAALASASPEPMVGMSPDDLYILYTGGTTGMPKGVLWRQADVYPAAFTGRRNDGSEYESVEEIVAAAKARPQAYVLPAPPFMHGAAHWSAFSNLLAGRAVVIQSDPSRLDADDLLSTVEREGVSALLIVGDAFARPLLDQLERKTYDLRSLRAIITGGAALNAGLKRSLMERIPGVRIVDSIGSSESGFQGQNVSTPATTTTTGTFEPGPGTCILSEDLTRVLPPGHEELGWFAKRGRVPLGYLGDPEKTERTFPVIDGVRYSVPGDRARQRADGVIEVHGRDSVTINSGGEKIFAEEVEHALKLHPCVYDAVVVGRPSERWGQEVVALVHLRAGMSADRDALLETCAEHLARYKLPKEILFLDAIVRSPSGKADYRWAREQASTAKR